MQLATSCSCRPSTLISRTCETATVAGVLVDPPQAESAAAAISGSGKARRFMVRQGVAEAETIATDDDLRVTPPARHGDAAPRPRAGEGCLLYTSPSPRDRT